jgi:hypothetical protein
VQSARVWVGLSGHVAMCESDLANDDRQLTRSGADPVQQSE